MFRKFSLLSALLLLVACDKEPGPTVVTLSGETGVIEVAANQLSGVAIRGEGLNAALSFRMDADNARAFSEMTNAIIGKPISIAICGEVVSEPFVKERIGGGSLQISGYSVAELKVYLSKLNGSEPC